MAEQRAMTTYRLADGTLAGDFMFVTELEWFENDSEPTDLIREVGGWLEPSRHDTGNWAWRSPGYSYPDEFAYLSPDEADRLRTILEPGGDK